ncbi:hypothetical protein D3C84_634540 [compost metagenome]
MLSYLPLEFEISDLLGGGVLQAFYSRAGGSLLEQVLLLFFQYGFGLIKLLGNVSVVAQQLIMYQIEYLLVGGFDIADTCTKRPIGQHHADGGLWEVSDIFES